jgi:ABC-type transporter Mla subunit MlaD
MMAKKNSSMIDRLDKIRAKRFISIIKRLSKISDQVAKKRDELDDLIADAEALREDCSNAYEGLIAARDSLSEMV